jgi:hypothetical protein
VRCWGHSEYWEVQSNDKTVQGQKALISSHFISHGHTLKILTLWRRGISCHMARIVTTLLLSENGKYFFGVLVKFRKATVSLVTSVRPVGTTRPWLDGFSWNFRREDFSKMYGKNSSTLISDRSGRNVILILLSICNKIWLNSPQNEKYCRNFCSENQNMHIIFNFFSCSCAVYQITWKILYSQTGHRWHNTSYVLRMLNN